MTLYLMVTKDKYELPLCVADTVPELAKMVGTTTNTIYSMMGHEKTGKCRSKFKKVEVEE